MNDWLINAANQTAPAILVTVALTEGSAPREAGAKMLVTADAQYDTIGGGHLELRACEIARAMLAMTPIGIEFAHSTSLQNTSTNSRLERFSLGPSLGQCCGGVMVCAFELIDEAAWQELACLRQQLQQGNPSWRLIPLDNAAPSVTVDAAGNVLNPSGAAGFSTAFPAKFQRDAACHMMQDEAGQQWLIDPIVPPRAQLFLFGAGHVGAALVRALADLPCRISWIDERADMFPASVPTNVSIVAAEYPEDLVKDAPAGATYLVMTHQHALDQRIAEAILRRGDSGWFGLIGSHTKRTLFEHRLRDRGIAPDCLNKLVCPIGLPGIASKVPAVIAASVAAQLLQVWEAQENALAGELFKR
ncbi:MAG: xanthine dehydrogenase accessory protein XdhC [Pseudomonadota bacterium]